MKCRKGWRATGGGFRVPDEYSRDYKIIGSWPGGDRWFVQAYKYDGGWKPYWPERYVICTR